MKTYKEFIQKKRMELGVNRNEMAESLGYSVTYLCRIENSNQIITDEFVDKLNSTFVFEDDELEELKYLVSKCQEEFTKNTKMQQYKEFIKKKRKVWGVNAKKMAIKLGYTPEFFSRIENGRNNMPLDFVEKIKNTFFLNDNELDELNHIVSKFQKKSLYLLNIEMQAYKLFIAELRRKWGINGKKMAEKLGYNLIMFYNIENGRRNIPFDFVDRIQEAFILNDAESKELKILIHEIQKKYTVSKNTKMQKYKLFIKKKREVWGITGKEMAIKLGYSFSHFFNIENGNSNMSLDFVNKLKETFLFNDDELNELDIIVFEIHKINESIRDMKIKSYKQFMKKKRADWGINMKEMAEKLGYNSTYFYLIENEKHKMPLDFVEKIQKTFGLSGEELNELESIVQRLRTYSKL